MWPMLKLITQPPTSLWCFCAYLFLQQIINPHRWENHDLFIFVSFASLPQCVSNSKCSTNVSEICFVVLSVARLPMELVYGCSQGPCGHTSSGGFGAVLSQNSARGRYISPAYSGKSQGWFIRDQGTAGSTSESRTKDTNFPSSLSHRKVLVVNLLHGAEFISWKVMVQVCLIKETHNTRECLEGKEETSSFTMMRYSWLASRREGSHRPEPHGLNESKMQQQN